MTTLPPEAFACRPLECAELPRTVWHIAVAALIGNAWGPVHDVASQFVVSGSRWSGPMGRPARREMLLPVYGIVPLRFEDPDAETLPEGSCGECGGNPCRCAS